MAVKRRHGAEFAIAVKALRAELIQTQAEMAIDLGVGKTTIQGWETRQTIPDKRTWQKIVCKYQDTTAFPALKSAYVAESSALSQSRV